MATILITGGSGQVGRSLRDLAPDFPDFQFLHPVREELDLTHHEQVANYLLEHQPDYVLNAAAYTAVDRAESERDAAWRVNAEAPGLLAEQCARVGAHLVHYSTDYVYADHYNRPLREDDHLAPASVYGASKLAGEQAVQQALPAATILRTAWVFSPYGHNFVRTMIRLGRQRPSLGVVYDQIGSPTYAADLARTTLELIRRVEAGEWERHTLAGTFNYSNEGVCSWYDFALAIFSLTGIDCQVTPILTQDYPTPARRPHFSLLSKEHIKARFGLAIPHWRTSLHECLDILKRKQA